MNYFEEWLKVIDKAELNKVTNILGRMYRNTPICPAQKDVFNAFKYCKLSDLKIVMIGQDPYPQINTATGILFGNSKETPEELLSPSLKIIKEAVINFEMPHNCIIFDNSLLSWAKQGILMINGALTVEMNKIGSHTMLWRPFISKLLSNLSIYPGIIYVLFGKQAQTFEPYIKKNNYIIKVEHPAYFARTNTKMPYKVFKDINDIMIKQYGETIKWYEENG